MVSYSYPLDFPSAAVFAVDYAPQHASAIGRSPFTLKGDVQAYQGQLRRWTVTLAPQQDQDTIAALETFLLKLNGREGTFLLGDPARASARGSYDSGSDTPLLDSAGSPSVNLEGDRVLVTDGWRSNQTGLLKAGDPIQLGSGATASLHTCLDDVDSDGSGIAEIDIWPRLRRTHADNAPLTITGAKGLWKLAGDPQWSVSPGLIYDGFTFDIVEWWT